MRAIPHWMPWAEGGRSLSTLHHEHPPPRHLPLLASATRAGVLASTRPDPRTKFPHDDGINLYILEYENGARASAWDDVWAGPVREGAAGDIGIRWRVEGTEGLALGTIGWPGWPDAVPSTIDFTSSDDPGLASPPMARGLVPRRLRRHDGRPARALERGDEPDISGRDNLRTIALCEAGYRAPDEHRAVVRVDEIHA